MGDQDGRHLSFIGILLLAAFGTFLWETIPLESSRPPGASQAVYVKDRGNEVPARLWQDPFKAIYIDPSIKKALNEKNFSNIPSCDLYAIAPEFIKDPDQELKILAAMVSMGSESENEERRRRRRYAVLSALGQAGFIPDNSTRIRFCKWESVDPAQALNGSEMIVPYELFRDEKLSSQSRVLLLWLNESRFADEPLGRFGSLVEQLVRAPDPIDGYSTVGRCTNKCAFFVLGPDRSATLKKMAEMAVRECPHGSRDSCLFNQQIKQSGIKGFHILSPTATAAGNQLFRNSEAFGQAGETTPLDSVRDAFSAKECNSGADKHDDFCVSFLRTIRSDDELASVLVEELSKRDVEFGKDRVALISEWDSLFGRSLPRSFELEFCRQPPPYLRSEVKPLCGDEIYKFSYLRGIDGHYSTYRSAEIQNKAEEVDSAKDLLSQDDRNLIRRPAGTGQFDYLRRLAEELEELDQMAKSKNEKRIGAIGILGSDVYDKLLILRALRPQFPGVIFFTTDLDAQLLHPSDFQWTRNLIVASSFNLLLDRELQGNIPPFRNSYQTSVFLSTLLATKYGYPSVNDKINFQSQNDFINHIPALLFEVGRNGAVQLNELEPGNASEPDVVLHEKASQTGFPLSAVFAFFLVAALMVVIVHQLKPLSRHVLLFLSIMLFGLLCLVLIAGQLHAYEEEPLSFIDGVSIWPTEIIRFISLCLAVSVIAGILSGRLLPNFEFPAGQQEVESKGRSSEGGIKPAEPCSFAGLLRQIKQIPAYFYGVMILFFFGLVGIKLTMAPLPTGELLFYWLVFIPLSLWVVSVFTDSKTEAQFPEKGKWSIQGYLNEYNRLGSPKERVLRSVKMWLLFIAMASLLFSLTDLPHIPFRGEWTRMMDRIILISSVFTMLFLIYLVIDAFLICSNWIKGLQDPGVFWEGPHLQQVCQDHKVGPVFGVELFKIQMIAKNTDDLCQLIYYPFLIVMMMMLSRSSYFDNWGLPQGIAIVVVINIFLLIGSTHRLRKNAEICRSQAIERLKISLTSLSGEAEREEEPEAAIPKYKTTVRQAGFLIDEIKSIRSGAFQPFLEQPMVRASLILLGAIGLSVSEYLVLFR